MSEQGRFNFNRVMPRWETLAQVTWCEACVRSGTGHDIVHVNAISGTGFASMAVKSMQLMDWLALVFASILLGLAVNGELKVRVRGVILSLSV